MPRGDPVFSNANFIFASDFLALNRVPNVSAPQYADTAYSATSSPVHATPYPPSSYDHMGYASTSMRSSYGIPPSDAARRFSQPLVPTFPALAGL